MGLSPPAPRAFASFGQDSWIVPPARVERPECIRVGDRVIIHEHAWLAVGNGRSRPEPCLEFGDDTRINRFVNIVCHASVKFGKGVLVGDRAYISDVEYPVGHPGAHPSWLPAAEPRPVVVEDGVYLGAGAIVMPGVTIGRFAYVSAASIVTENVAARTLVAGAPARALRRWDGTDQADG